MDLNHYYDDINAGTGDVIEREYGYAEPGANRYIKLIVRDEEGQPIRYETMEDISISSNRKFSIDTGKSGLNLPVGTYTLQVFVEEDNSAVAGKSNHASEIYETKLNLQQSLTAADVSESGDKASTGSDYYNENGVIFTIKNTDENGNIGNTYPYIRVGTKDELNNNTIGFTTASSTYKKDGIYERKQDDDSNALFVELCTNSDGSGQKTTMLPIESVKIDAKDPYFSSGKNGEGKPLTLEDGEGEHKKVIPHANDYTSDMYNGDTLKPDAVPIENGIKSYKLTATPLTTDGKVDDSKEVITQTIQTADEKFKDCEPYFELQGKEAFWVKVTAVDQAGRETTIEQKLYMDSTQPAAPAVSAVLKDGSDTVYAGGDIKNEDDQIIPNWSGSDIKITLSLSADELKELKYGVDHYEYTTTAEIKAWTDAGNKAEDLVWKSLGKKAGSDEALNVFETDSSKVSEDAEYHFRAVSRADVKGKEKVFKVRKDKAIPKLSLKIIDVATQEEYVEGAAAKKGLRFTITPDGEIPVSGVKYYCRGVPSGWKPKARADGDLPSDEEIPWSEIQKKNGSYSILIADDFEGTYYSVQ